jgi:hypothetical protein
VTLSFAEVETLVTGYQALGTDDAQIWLHSRLRAVADVGGRQHGKAVWARRLKEVAQSIARSLVLPSRCRALTNSTPSMSS